ncbi:MAG: Uncharacterised protein [Bacteroidetes bacterium MED-G17]|nr:MAG: Uncharacterised protein [Bacteroidetes bacterium MED-G17]
MKKSLQLIFLSIICFSANFSWGQGVELPRKRQFKPLNQKRHELRIGAIKSLAIPSYDIEYEKDFSNNSSFGATLLINGNSDSRVLRLNLMATPYFRFYFNKQKDYGMQGIFAQGYVGYYNVDRDNGRFVNDTTGNYPWSNFISNWESIHNLGYGFGFGKKWTQSSGFTLSIFTGFSRTTRGFGSPEFWRTWDDVNGNQRQPKESDYRHVLFNADIHLGYRF